MTQKQIIALAAVAAVAYFFGYRRALAAATNTSNGAPLVGSDPASFMNWQAV